MNPKEILPRARVLRVLAALGVASAGCCLINAAQYFLSEHIRFRFLYWNLVLAWIPLMLAVAAARLEQSPRRRPWALGLCAAAWFIFFPNAPYIVTDFVHLPDSGLKSLWYLDLLILLSFAWTGLCLGYVSLHLMQEIVRRRCGLWWGWGFAVGVLAFSSFGIYLGRFSRWNSWDVVRHPARLLADCLRMLDPYAHPNTLAFSGTIFLFLLISYCALFAFTSLRGRPLGT